MLATHLETQVLFKTRFYETRILKKWYIVKYFRNSTNLLQILSKHGI